jgi:hypothetical protein
MYSRPQKAEDFEAAGMQRNLADRIPGQRGSACNRQKLHVIVNARWQKQERIP